MSEKIRAYYQNTKLDERLINKKLELFSRHEDIMWEFEYWIENREYKSDGVVVEGYSANSLAKISKFMDGEGAFVLLMELRQNPERTLKQIAAGFKMK